MDLHFLREIFELGRFMLYWIHGAVNGADIYTKAVPRQIILKLRDMETGYSTDGVLPSKAMKS